MSAASTPIADLRSVKSSGRLTSYQMCSRNRGAAQAVRPNSKSRDRRWIEVAADTVAIIAKRVPADKRNLSMTDRLEDLNINSFSAVEMIYDLEEKFDVAFPYNSNDNLARAAPNCGRPR